MQTVGLVLSGGGARAIAHLGLLQLMDEMSIMPDVISGVSAGAIIGALYASGMAPKQILNVVKENNSLAKIVLSSGGLFTATGLQQILNSALPMDDFDRLSVPLYVTATDMISGTSVTFSKGPLIDVLIGSSSVPVLFTPKKHDRQRLVDGGVLNNLPAECLAGKCDKIIGSHVNRRYKPAKNLDRLHVFDQCFHMAIAKNVAQNSALCDILFEPELDKYSMFDIKYADRLFKVGYQTAKDNKELTSMAETVRQ
ncbi:patatin-like phospholipase family protein [Mucilaginibacter flavidus]|uniref:patatin-like phospholipase family protein n=1 Tax=Mucilaginibacter flavidus TaxID=2949309 RepID=UPI002093BB77|nr:patatin-like phospholipase family protein [Mucilaginibacter flavidus]MCO5950198.1 patatin-like phospholipase family protein [Mucilaginibacter flavidus]